MIMGIVLSVRVFIFLLLHSALGYMSLEEFERKLVKTKDSRLTEYSLFCINSKS